MTKKRVYQLARELGLENRELISRLVKIGIAVRSHSSALDDSDLEKIQSELLPPDPQGLVEQRIKTTVIRRRAVHLSAEETAKPSKGEPYANTAPQAAHLEATPKENLPVPAPKEVPVRTSIYRDRPAVRALLKPIAPVEAVHRPSKPARPAAQVETVSLKALASEPKAGSIKKPVQTVRPKVPMAEKKPLPVRPPEHREGKLPQIEIERKPQTSSAAVRPVPSFPREKLSTGRDPKIVKGVEIASPFDKACKPEAEKPMKEEGKPPVGALMDETAAARKLARIRKLDRKRKRIELEHGGRRRSKSREGKKVRPLGLMVDPSLPARAGVNNRDRTFFSAVAIALCKLKGSIQAYLKSLWAKGRFRCRRIVAKAGNSV